MLLKKLTEFSEEEIHGKRFLVRVDFNVPLGEKGEILDTFRIDKSLPTLKWLHHRGAKLILLSHLGRPQGIRQERYSLSPLLGYLKTFFEKEVFFLSDCVGKEIEVWTREMAPGEIVLLENLRFYKEETEGNEEFAKQLARLGDVFVNEAFSVSHRKHASVYVLPQLLPSTIGFLFEEEWQKWEEIREKSLSPRVLILGGAKSSKIKLLPELLSWADIVLIGGKQIERVLRAKGVLRPVLEDLKELLKDVSLADSKIRLPIDVVVSPLDRSYLRVSAPAFKRESEEILDIGPDTRELWKKIIKEAKTVVLAGVLGKVEEREFSLGTSAIVQALAQSNAFKVAAGMDTISFLSRHYFTPYFDFLSTGGGASLHFLAKGTLPALEVLKQERE